MNCIHQRDMCALQVRCSLTRVLQRWYSSVNRALERREKETLKTQDSQYVKAFAKNL